MSAAKGLKARLAAASKAALPSFVLTALDGETVNIRRLGTDGIRQWWVFEHNEGKGRKYEEKLKELWVRCACEEDGTAISGNVADVDALVDKFGGAFLVEFDRAARRVNFLFVNNADEDAERTRFFMVRGLDAARLNGSPGQPKDSSTTAKTSSTESPSGAARA